MKAVTDSLHNLGTSFIQYPLVIITSIIVTRILGPEGKGIYVYLIMMGGVILPISFMGIGNGIQYFISNKKYNLKEAAIPTLMAGILTGLLVALLIYSLWTSKLFGASGNSTPFWVLVCFLFGLPLDGLIYTSRFLLIGDSQFKTINYLALANSGLSSILLIAFILFMDYKLLAVAIAINFVKIIVWSYTAYFIQTKYHPKWSLNISYLKDVYAYGIKSWLGNISARANDQLDQLIIGTFVGPANLGIYSVAYAVVNLLLIPSNAISPILFNEISRLKNLKKSAFKAAQVHRALFIVVFVIGILLAIASYWLIPLFYGIEFKGAFIPLLILIPGIIIYSVSRRVLQKFLAANGFPLKTSLVQFIAAVTGVIFYIILIPKYDIIGAAIGSTIAYITSMFVAYYLTIKLVNVKFDFFKFSISDVHWIIDKVKKIPLKKSLL